jgi:hypothetical protein
MMPEAVPAHGVGKQQAQGSEEPFPVAGRCRICNELKASAVDQRNECSS